MIAQVHTGCIDGVEALLVQVEVALTTALPAFSVVGLAQGSVREGRERVAAALRASGHPLPPRRITVNLAPADVRKVGTAFDLPIAVGILAAAGIVPVEHLRSAAFLGEVGLDGRLRPVTGVLPVALEVRRAGLETLFVPAGCEAEASLATGLRVLAPDDLISVIRTLRGEEAAPAPERFIAAGSPASGERTSGISARSPGISARSPRISARSARISDHASAARHRVEPRRSGGLSAASRGGRAPDLRDVLGQEAGKRALEIAVAGRHHLLMTGPPGSGKTMLARRIQGLLPPLAEEEALEVAKIRSIAGLSLSPDDYFEPPFRAPHHSVSYAGLVGGGRPVTPGEISLSHRGVLFLDELPEFRRDAIEVLRQPLEEGEVTLARAAGAVRLPCDFLLVAAMNPCPCGYLGDPMNRCACDPHAVRRYRARVSGPLMDRIDLVVEMPAPAVELFLTDPAAPAPSLPSPSGPSTPPSPLSPPNPPRPPTSTAIAAERVSAARMLRHRRPARPVEHRLDDPARRLLEASAAGGGLSARGFRRVLRVAGTIADLAGTDVITAVHLAEALHFRLPGVPGL